MYPRQGRRNGPISFAHYKNADPNERPQARFKIVRRLEHAGSCLCGASRQGGKLRTRGQQRVIRRKSAIPCRVYTHLNSGHPVKQGEAAVRSEAELPVRSTSNALGGFSFCPGAPPTPLKKPTRSRWAELEGSCHAVIRSWHTMRELQHPSESYETFEGPFTGARRPGGHATTTTRESTVSGAR